MKKYLSLLKYEFKTIIKDPTNLMMVLYPFLVLFIVGVIMPLAMDKVDNKNAAATTLLILLAAVLAVGVFVIGALLGFSLIENKDEKTILSICVTPVKVEGYTIFKVVYTYVFSFIGNLVIVGGLKIIAKDTFVIETGAEPIYLLNNLSWLQIVIFALVNSLFVPAIALIIGGVAKNKIEAFAMMKSSGFMIMIPALTLLNFFKDWKQYLLGFAPNFWPIKAMLNEAMGELATHSSNLNYYLYMVIGTIYFLFLSIVSLRFFIKKIN